MPLCSMTGFARVDGAGEGYRWTWEVRSVNGKGLDIRLRVPPGFDQSSRRPASESPRVWPAATSRPAFPPSMNGRDPHTHQRGRAGRCVAAMQRVGKHDA